MECLRYRRAGLPTTSRLVESLAGEFNAWVEGGGSYRTRPHVGESILQLRAALRSLDRRVEQYFALGPGGAFGKRTRAVSPQMQTAN